MLMNSLGSVAYTNYDMLLIKIPLIALFYSES
jgi:hypothetical protein